jgi:inosose dehydratase
VVHVHLKNAATTDADEEYRTPAAEYTVLRAGGARAVGRWFLELGTEPLLVDSPAVVTALADTGYDGWVVVESDFTPHQATSVMLNGWEVQHVLAPLT